MQRLVTTYQELADLVTIFNQGKLDIMIVEGTAGVGKSSIVKKNLPKDGHLWLEGRVSAFMMFQSLYDKRDLPVYIDDVDGLLGNKDSVNLLKCVCQTEQIKTVMWNTKSATEVKQFETSSKVLVITNDWKSLNKHVDAVEDRGLLVRFKPDAQEVHNHIKGFFDIEVYNFIGEHLPLIREPSMRMYRTASQLKSMDWKGMLLESFKLKKESWITILKLKEAVHLSENQKAKEFAIQTGLDERTYWRIKSDLKKKGIRFK